MLDAGNMPVVFVLVELNLVLYGGIYDFPERTSSCFKRDFLLSPKGPGSTLSGSNPQNY